jgi:hypothetical protein
MDRIGLLLSFLATIWLVSSAVNGCSQSSTPNSSKPYNTEKKVNLLTDVRVFTREIDNHKYVIADGSECCSIVHAASCHCLNKNN